MISIIAIVARDGAIGRGGDQPFHIREDFRRFKELTLGKPIVMGRRTFDALPKGALPGRRNIVITRSREWSAPDVEVASSLDEAVAMCSEAPEVMIIGGGQIYNQSMELADKLYITEVDATVDDADTYFPAIPPTEWRMVDASEYMGENPRYRFVTYLRSEECESK